MARIVVTESASSDEASILGDLGTGACLPTAEKFLVLFRNLRDLLAAHPDAGAPRRALGRIYASGSSRPTPSVITTPRTATR